MFVRFSKPVLFAALGLMLLSTSACSISVVLENPTPPVKTDPAEPTQESSLPADPAPEPTISPTNTPQAAISPTQPPLPPPAPTQAPVEVDPAIKTRDVTEVRTGPGMTFALSHFLELGTQAPVQGRSANGLWWAIPGAGDGPGPLGWVRADMVDFIGDASRVAILPPPAAVVPDVPIHFDPGSPPSNACVAEPFGSGLGPVLVRLGPGEQFNVTHRLGGWVEVLKAEVGWLMVLLGPGETGWVNGSEVKTSGPCP
jgi:hypothetical protein